MRTLLNHCHLIVDGNKEYLDGAILLKDEYIEEVFPHTNKLEIKDKDYEEIDLQGAIVMPGFFDTHIHEIGGYSFENKNNFNIDELSKVLARRGTTAFLASTTSINMLDKLNDLNTSAAKCLGVHLEGPFLSEGKLGVIKKENILKPNKEDIIRILDLNSNIKQMTIAPELEKIEEVIDILKEKNIKVMLGHSLFCGKEIKNYYDGFTHLYNAMSGFSHRELGLVNIAYNNPQKYIELVADTKHLDESVIRITLKNFYRDHIMLVSDAICVDDYKCDTLIIDEIKTMKKLGASYTDILLMSSLNAYRFYGLDNKYGSLYKGKYADLVVLDDNLNLLNVYVRGNKYA